LYPWVNYTPRSCHRGSERFLPGCRSGTSRASISLQTWSSQSRLQPASCSIGCEPTRPRSGTARIGRMAAPEPRGPGVTSLASCRAGSSRTFGSIITCPAQQAQAMSSSCGHCCYIALRCHEATDSVRLPVNDSAIRCQEGVLRLDLRSTHPIRQRPLIRISRRLLLALTLFRIKVLRLLRFHVRAHGRAAAQSEPAHLVGGALDALALSSSGVI